MPLHIVAFDAHWPKTDGPTLAALLDFLSRNSARIESFTFGGDQLDFECISHHTKGKGLYRLPGAYERDLESFYRTVLQPVEQRLSRRCTRIWHIGNHERFEHDLVEEQPELQGTVDHVARLRLEARHWSVVPLGHVSRIGKLVVVHGEVLSGIGNQAGMYPARKAVDLYGANVLAGHTHAPQSYTRIAPVEHIQKHMAWIAPILGAVNPGYLRNRPTAWLNGFVVVETHGTAFNVYPIIVTRGRFSYGGVIYGNR